MFILPILLAILGVEDLARQVFFSRAVPVMADFMITVAMVASIVCCLPSVFLLKLLSRLSWLVCFLQQTNHKQTYCSFSLSLCIFFFFLFCECVCFITPFYQYYFYVLVFLMYVFSPHIHATHTLIKYYSQNSICG